MLLTAIWGEKMLVEGTLLSQNLSAKVLKDLIVMKNNQLRGLELFSLRCEKLATSLEKAIFKEFKQANTKYKNQVTIRIDCQTHLFLFDFSGHGTIQDVRIFQVRSRVFNLKDKNNAGLREGLLQVEVKIS